MAWYKDGTIQVAANGTVATGTGTAFLGNVKIGDGITIAGSTAQHEVTGVTSNTQLTFFPPYAGPEGSGKQYAVAPMLGYDKDLSDAINAWRLLYGSRMAALQPWAYAASPAEARINLELGSAATENVGTSGNAVAKLNAANSWSATQSFGAGIGVLSANFYEPGNSYRLNAIAYNNGLIFQRLANSGAYVSDMLWFDMSGNTLRFGCNFQPTSDNAFSVGTASARPSLVYAASGVISTSDAREKTEVRALTESEIEWALLLAEEVGAYQFLHSVELKGNFARDHIGMTVQRAIELGEQAGCEPHNYSFICHDQWPARTEVVTPARYEPIEHPATDDNEAWTEQVLVEEAVTHELPAGDRYSFRESGLYAFIIAGQAARAKRNEARLAALEQALNITN